MHQPTKNRLGASIHSWQGWLGSPLALAFFVGFLLNGPVAFFRFNDFYRGRPMAWAYAALELVCVASLTWLLLSLARLLGRRATRLLGGLLLVISAVCAYYMVFFKVTIGHGLVGAVFTLDHDLSGEVLGWQVVVFVVLTGLLPAWAWWKAHSTHTSWYRRRQPWTPLALALLGVGMSWGVFKWTQVQLNAVSQQMVQNDAEAPINLPGVVAHSYVPSNWLAGLSLMGYGRYKDWQLAKQLTNPADRFSYEPAVDLKDVHVVVVVGETARFDRFGLLGHERDTTPRLSQEKNLAAFAAKSCDTATKLSLACMFVRSEAIQTNPSTDLDAISERNVFAVFEHLGFDIDLFALQSEVGFYAQTAAKNLKFREVIAAQAGNAGQPIHDELLIKELAGSVGRPNPTHQPRLTVLHTKGSHFLYTNRYPRSFAKWTPECESIDQSCSKQDMLNAFDNSILYTDHVLSQAIQTLRGRKAMLIYSSDHGESIEEGQHFHASPRSSAPIDQRKVPLMIWMSDELLKSPVIEQRFQSLRRRSEAAKPMQVTHASLFPSLLGCLGVTSKNGGITPELDLCH